MGKTKLLGISLLLFSVMAVPIFAYQHLWQSEPKQIQSGLTVTVYIYRIQLIDEIEVRWLEGEADWRYDIVIEDDKQINDNPYDQDNWYPNQEHEFVVSSLTIEFKIELWETDTASAWDTADISDYPGGGQDNTATCSRGARYEGIYDLRTNTIVVEQSDGFTEEGSYWKISGTDDGSGTWDENDVDMWFMISDNYDELLVEFSHPESIPISQVHLEVSIDCPSIDWALLVEFYTYSNVYQGNVTVWNGTADISLSENITHPQDKPIEKVYLIWRDLDMTEIKTIASFTMTRRDFFKRIIYLDFEWPYVSPDERSAIMNEIADIDIQWAYAPS